MFPKAEVVVHSFKPSPREAEDKEGLKLKASQDYLLSTNKQKSKNNYKQKS